MAKAKRTLEEVLFDDSSDMIDGRSKMDFDLAAQWKAAMEILDKLQAEGKLEYESDSLKKPHFLHTATIKWKFDDCGFVEMDARQIADVLSKTGSLLIDEDGAVWQLSQRIYKRVSD